MSDRTRFPRLTTPAPFATKVGKLPSPRKSLPSLQTAISTKPAKQGRRSPQWSPARCTSLFPTCPRARAWSKPSGCVRSA